jgi:hypothetical protein
MAPLWSKYNGSPASYGAAEKLPVGRNGSGDYWAHFDYFRAPTMRDSVPAFLRHVVGT